MHVIFEKAGAAVPFARWFGLCCTGDAGDGADLRGRQPEAISRYKGLLRREERPPRNDDLRHFHVSNASLMIRSPADPFSKVILAMR